jgi:predicted HicB family RNase H-like nuclease
VTYRGCTARVEYDPRDEAFVGRVLGIEDRITFHGATVVTLRRDFHAAVDHYLADCAARGRAPQKPYSGKILLRVAPEIHARAAMTAEAQGKSLNRWAAEVLAQRSLGRLFSPRFTPAGTPEPTGSAGRYDARQRPTRRRSG